MLDQKQSLQVSKKYLKKSRNKRNINEWKGKKQRMNFIFTLKRFYEIDLFHTYLHS